MHVQRFGLGLMQKDVQVAVDAASANDLRTPVLSGLTANALFASC